MKYLVIFKKQEGEKTNAYSIVSDSMLKNVRKQAPVLHEVELDQKRVYSKSEIEKLVKEKTK